MMNEHGSRTSGYALAFLAGAVGGALATKGAPAVLAKMQEHCHRMMEAGCCAPSSELGAASSCCGPMKESSSEESRPQGKAA